jgi:hypothetical protein
VFKLVLLPSEMSRDVRQVMKQDIMKHMGRPATALEAEKVNAEVASIHAESARADDILLVSHCAH